MSAGMGQDDIDKMLSDALNGIATDDNANGGGGDIGAAQNQNDIDAMFAAAASDSTPANQNDIDALLAANNADDAPANQNDIDALLAAATQNDAAPKSDDKNNDNAAQGQDDIDAMFAANATPSANDDSGAPEQNDLDALLAAADSEPANDDDLSALLDASAAIAKPATNQDDVDELLNAAQNTNNDFDDLLNNAENVVNDAETPSEDDLLSNTAPDAFAKNIAPTPNVPKKSAPPMPKMPPHKPLEIPELSPEQLAALQDSLSLSGSSGEVENISGQIAGLLGQLSEKSRRYQIAWTAAEQQARELRYLQTVNDHKIHVLVAEKETAMQEADLLRKQHNRAEGEKLAASEAHRTEIAALQLRIREQESRNQMMQSETNALKEELERARNCSTGADLESRRARFDSERLTGELSSERQERNRLARALENREKELQAMQAHSAGHASTLFLDELHRLVRRLESELDVRGSAATEALSILDRMEFPAELQLYATTLRSSLCIAAGLSPDESDALKSLEHKNNFNPQAPLTPAIAPGEDTFVKALTRYDFTRASGICSALLRAGNKSTLDCMKEIYPLEALKHPEIAQHLDELSSMLSGLKNLQEASDRSRGRENENTEKVFVMMFDLLHTLVRLKLISRATPIIWDLFLELRGRFSFLTSDRQWKEYRDRVLQNKQLANA